MISHEVIEKLEAIKGNGHFRLFEEDAGWRAIILHKDKTTIKGSGKTPEEAIQNLITEHDRLISKSCPQYNPLQIFTPSIDYSYGKQAKPKKKDVDS